MPCGKSLPIRNWKVTQKNTKATYAALKTSTKYFKNSVENAKTLLPKKYRPKKYGGN